MLVFMCEWPKPYGFRVVRHGQKPVKSKDPTIGIALTGPAGKLAVDGPKKLSPCGGIFAIHPGLLASAQYPWNCTQNGLGAVRQ